ncbi:hypothetical protein [Streptomyces sp. H39-S7]|uniref:hypothetical protein n=1 Tax=Streptomyces sp. H39-S7 TaxID=3004357 RepID=UPI0022AEB042|nr:hypothetical protein [Streptomyces sp. H39-S7]MCZ4124860.1 hypothetical protein [Streptomyces sp. H39-S7]
MARTVPLCFAEAANLLPCTEAIGSSLVEDGGQGTCDVSGPGADVFAVAEVTDPALFPELAGDESTGPIGELTAEGGVAVYTQLGGDADNRRNGRDGALGGRTVEWSAAEQRDFLLGQRLAVAAD